MDDILNFFLVRKEQASKPLSLVSILYNHSRSK